LDFVCEELEGTALVRGNEGPVFFKLNDGLEAEGGGGDLWLEDPNEVGGSCFGEVNDNQLQDYGSIDLLTDSFGKREAGETLF
jgi:hypothetical protein